MRILRYLFVIVTLISCGSAGHKNDQKAPNVLFIAVDDLNDWTGNLKGHPNAITPNLDRLSQMGTSFTNAHASMAVCVASRNSLLSGLHPTTTGWYALVKDHHAMEESYDEVMGDKQMLPAFFKINGYKTWCAGKIFHKGASDFEFLINDLWDDVLPEYKSKLRPIDYERGGGYKGYKFYPFPKEGSQVKNHYGEKISFGHSLCGGPLDANDIPEGKMYDELIADYAVSKLKEKHDDPFFLSVGFVRPHVPYTAPRKYFDLYQKAEIKLPECPNNDLSDIPLMGKSIAFNYGTNMGDYEMVKGMDDDYYRHLVHSYLACVSFVDDQLGRVLSALEKSDYADNTIIVLWSDHGQSFGEKRTYRKMSLWEESTHVPLYIVYPGNKSAQCDQAVSLLDIYPTLVDLCGLPKPDHLDGQSLKPLLEKTDAEWNHPVVSSWRYENYAVRSNDYRYIRYRDGSEEFYDHTMDEGEFNNLANDDQYKEQIEWHRSFIPSSPTLPVGMKQWTGDELDATIQKWQSNNTMPDWLK
ncbi:MAG: sulfatase [Carboxylicivirga sp.]|jgi:iduronate 2-sulfatase|nr:sulfatase [Carboxylicivirga sp.]